jgi:hypothetical protein
MGVVHLFEKKLKNLIVNFRAEQAETPPFAAFLAMKCPTGS